MLKLILDNPPPQPKTLEQSHAVIKDLWQLVGELSGRIDQLEEQLGVHSGNSSSPPSQDSLKQRAKRKKKPPSDRQQGAQPGHKKHQRELLPEDQMNQVQRFYPQGRCACGGEVKPEIRASRRHQVFDVPEKSFKSR